MTCPISLLISFVWMFENAINDLAVFFLKKKNTYSKTLNNFKIYKFLLYFIYVRFFLYIFITQLYIYKRKFIFFIFFYYFWNKTNLEFYNLSILFFTQ